MSALAGIRVVELASERIAFAGKLLADMGADVILVEPPGGDPSRAYPPFVDDEPGEGRSLYWMHYHTSKRGVVIDLDDEAGRERFRQLVASADVLLESEPWRRLAELGLDYEDLVGAREDLIHVSVTPFGRDDPRSAEPVTDLTILAAGGPAWSCGYDDHSIPPVRGGGNQGYNTACHYAVMSALTAVLHHGVSGEGQFVDVSMHAAANVTTEMSSYFWLVCQQTVQRQTGRHAMPDMTMSTQITCADGKHASSGVPPRKPEEFGRLHGWLVELGLADELPEAIFLEMGANYEGHFDLSKIGEDDTVTAIFGAGREALNFIASKVSAYDFFYGCQKAGLTVGVIYSPEEAYEDEHFKARGFQAEVEHPELSRTLRYPGAPYLFEKSAWSISRPAPRLGEHDDEVFGALG